jgi:hypothetical protein
MSRARHAKRTDQNQKEIVAALRTMGFSVYVDVDDILVGSDGFNFWYEIKKPEAVSKKTGKILDSAKRSGQINLEKEWKGHYLIVSSLDEILDDIRSL